MPPFTCPPRGHTAQASGTGWMDATHFWLPRALLLSRAGVETLTPRPDWVKLSVFVQLTSQDFFYILND